MSGSSPAGGGGEARHFIRQLIDADIASGRWGAVGDGSVVSTRFPPEPNGFLHVGHAKSIVLNWGLARSYGGRFVLRFDDTNPVKEESRYVESITEDVRWLGAEWDGEVRFASDYFERMYAWALELIEKGKAYVDEQPTELIREQRGTLTRSGTPSPWRDRPSEESAALFGRMASGGMPDGSAVLRARIDMSSPNMNLRDPVMYRVLNATHHRTGDRWHVYPMYDWAHGLEDSIEGITHSVCTLEFEDHRPLYDWFICAINEGRGPGSRWGDRIHHPQQIEFARLNLSYTVTSKRLLLRLVEEGVVSGWDDPRMPTVAALRRRGYTPVSVRRFADGTGATKVNGVVDVGRLENAVREDLNARAPRRMCVLRPVKLTITNWGDHGDAERVEMMRALNNPEDEGAGYREVPFGRELYVERDDFMEDPPKKWFRLGVGREVRLRYGYWVTCEGVVRGAEGEVVELLCRYDPLTRGGDAPPAGEDGVQRKVKGTLHWVHAGSAVGVEVRLFDRLFDAESPGKRTGEPTDDLNPSSLEVLAGARLEPAWRTTEVERASGTGAWADGSERFQFERQGYFCLDASSSADGPVFNRTVTLKDSWAKAARKG